MRRTLLAVCFALVLPAAASAQIDTRGKFSVQVAGFGTLAEGNTTGTVLGGLTTFVTKAIEIGGDVSLSASNGQDEFGESTVNTTGFLTARLRYNLVGQSLTVPFLSLGMGTSIGSDISSQIFNAGGGFKRFLNERVSLNGEANYQTIQQGDFDAGGGFIVEGGSSSAIQFLVGISIYTGR